MRYIIMPLVIILYSWWSYNSIKDMWKCRDGSIIKDSTLMWITITLMITLVIIMPAILFTIFKYW